MTAVAFISINGMQLLAADYALSISTNHADPPCSVPSREISPTESKLYDSKIVELASKTVKVGTDLVFACAGKYEYAVEIIQKLGYEYTTDWSHEHIREWFENLQNNELDGVSFIAMQCSEKQVYSIGINSEIYHIEGAEYVVATGTGGQAMAQDIVSTINNTHTSPHLNLKYTQYNPVDAIDVVTSLLLRKELTNDYGFKQSYGGGYDIWFGGENEVYRVAGAMYCFIDAMIDIHSGEFMIRPVWLVQYQSIDDGQVVNTLFCDGFSESGINARLHRVVRIKSYNLDSMIKLTQPPPFVLSRICTNISFFSKDSGALLGSKVSVNHGTSFSYGEMRNEGYSVTVEWDYTALKEAIQQFMDGWNRHHERNE